MTTVGSVASFKSAEEFHVVATPGTDYTCDVANYKSWAITPSASIDILMTGFEAGLEFFIDIDPDGNTITFDATDFEWLNGTPTMPASGERIIVSGICSATAAKATWMHTGSRPVNPAWQTLSVSVTVIQWDGALGCNVNISEASVSSSNTLATPSNVADGATGSIVVQGGASVSWFALNGNWELGDTTAGAARALSDITLPTSNANAILFTWQRRGTKYLLIPMDNHTVPY